MYIPWNERTSSVSFAFLWLYQQFFADFRDQNAPMQMVYEIRVV